MSRTFNQNRAMEIYRYMIEFQSEFGFSLTMREIRYQFNYKSHSGVYLYVQWLIDNGYVKTRGKQFRALAEEERKIG